MTRLNKMSANGVACCHHKIAEIFHRSRTLSVCVITVICLMQLTLVQCAYGGVNHNEFLAQLKVPQCRKDCLDKVSHELTKPMKYFSEKNHNTNIL